MDHLNGISVAVFELRPPVTLFNWGLLFSVLYGYCVKSVN
jgi:hypothetical protein